MIDSFTTIASFKKEGGLMVKVSYFLGIKENIDTIAPKILSMLLQEQTPGIKHFVLANGKIWDVEEQTTRQPFHVNNEERESAFPSLYDAIQWFDNLDLAEDMAFIKSIKK